MLTRAGVPCAPVLTRTQTLSDPQIVANEIVVEVNHPTAGRLRQSRPAARFSMTPQAIRASAPAYGEHTEEALGEAGLSREEIDELRRQGAFGPARETVS